jgi:hypothetical protein
MCWCACVSRAVLQELNAAKPKDSAGLFMRQAYLKSTQGQQFFLDVDQPPFVSSKVTAPSK